jgi:hypothetical protein
MDLYLHLDLQDLDGTVNTADCRAQAPPTSPPRGDRSEKLADLDLRLEATRSGASLPDEH